MNTFQRTKISLAIKLSVLETKKITITEVLNHFEGEILIDAEFIRLDHWILDQLAIQAITSNSLNRIILTVQAKRADSVEQVRCLQNLGIRVVLVRGNAKYLEGVQQVKNAFSQIATIWREFDNVVHLGIGDKLSKTLQQRYQLNLENHDRLGLYGEEISSIMWIYYSRGQLSEEGERFLARRKGNGGNYITNDLTTIIAQKLFVYVDVLDRYSFLNEIQLMECTIKPTL